MPPNGGHQVQPLRKAVHRPQGPMEIHGKPLDVLCGRCHHVDDFRVVRPICKDQLEYILPKRVERKIDQTYKMTANMIVKDVSKQNLNIKDDSKTQNLPSGNLT